MTQMVKNSHGIMPVLTARIGDFYQALQKLQTYHIISEKLFCVSWCVSLKKMKKKLSVFVWVLRNLDASISLRPYDHRKHVHL